MRKLDRARLRLHSSVMTGRENRRLSLIESINNSNVASLMYPPNHKLENILYNDQSSEATINEKRRIVPHGSLASRIVPQGSLAP